LHLGYTISKVLKALETLDKHNIDKATLFDLYKTIFDQILSEMDDAQVKIIIRFNEYVFVDSLELF